MKLAIVLAFLLTAARGAERGYLLGPDDVILIRAADVQEFSEKPVRIDLKGQINLPLIGRLEAAGMTPELLEGEIERRLKEFVLAPKVAVSVLEYHSQPVSILGAVQAAGVHQLQGRKTLYEVLSMAGGLRNEAGDVITITRRKENGTIPLSGSREDESGRFYIAEVNAKALLAAKSPQDNIVILPHDVISVPKAELIYVLGEVTRAGGFVLDQGGPVSLLQALSMAGGPQRLAHLSKARVLRLQPGSQVRAEIAVDLKRVLEGKGEDIRLRAEDILYVPNNSVKGFAVKAAEVATAITSGVIIWRAGTF